MRRTGLAQRTLAAALSVGAAWLLLSAALPHRHDQAASHPAQSCRICKIHDGFSAAPPAAPRLHDAPPAIAISRPLPLPAPRDLRVARLATSRAPPASS